MHKLLIVDDNENNRTLLCDTLDDGEYELSEAVDGKDALEKIEESPPDLILLDIEMPRMDGMEALRRLKANEETQNIPVIMVTALNADSQISACLDVGAVDHVVKPFSAMVVRARVRSALRSRNRARDNGSNGTKRAKVFTFLGAKGGVGTTTIAINVAAALANLKYNTVGCELRPDFGTSLVHLAASPALNLSLLLDTEAGKVTPQKVEDCLVSHSSGLRMLLGPQKEKEMGEILPDQAESVIAGLVKNADFVILDVPSNLSESTGVALRRSNFILLVTELEPASIVAAKRWVERIRALGIGDTGMGIIVNNRTIVSAPINLNNVRETLGCKLVGVVPPDADACMSAVRTGSPVVLSRSDSPMSAAFSILANRLTADQISELQF